MIPQQAGVIPMPTGSQYQYQGLSQAYPGAPARGWAGPGRPINLSYDGPRPGPAHQTILWWAAARPGPKILQNMGRGSARPIRCWEDGPRPGPAHHIFQNSRPGRARSFFFLVSAQPIPAHNIAARPMKHGLYIDRPENDAGRPIDLTGRQWAGPCVFS